MFHHVRPVGIKCRQNSTMSGSKVSTMRTNAICLKLVTNSSISCLRELSKYLTKKPGWGAGIRRMAVGLSIAVGLFAGSNASASTTYTVTTLDDTAGLCSGASCTTLRAALSVADGSAGNTIDLTGLSGTITLTSALPAIVQNMTITGPGENGLTISGNN